MSEKSILEMSDSELLELIARNAKARDDATQEKLVAREQDRKVREKKAKEKDASTAATDILKAYMERGAKPATKEKARDMASDILEAYMKSKKETK